MTTTVHLSTFLTLRGDDAVRDDAKDQWTQYNDLLRLHDSDLSITLDISTCFDIHSHLYVPDDETPTTTKSLCLPYFYLRTLNTSRTTPLSSLRFVILIRHRTSPKSITLALTSSHAVSIVFFAKYVVCKSSKINKVSMSHSRNEKCWEMSGPRRCGRATTSGRIGRRGYEERTDVDTKCPSQSTKMSVSMPWVWNCLFVLNRIFTLTGECLNSLVTCCYSHSNRHIRIRDRVHDLFIYSSKTQDTAVFIDSDSKLTHSSTPWKCLTVCRYELQNMKFESSIFVSWYFSAGRETQSWSERQFQSLMHLTAFLSYSRVSSSNLCDRTEWDTYEISNLSRRNHDRIRPSFRSRSNMKSL